MILAIDPDVFKARDNFKCRVLLEDISRNLQANSTNLRIAVDDATVSGEFWDIWKDLDCDRTDAEPEEILASELLDKICNPNDLCLEKIKLSVDEAPLKFPNYLGCKMLPVELELLTMAYELQRKGVNYTIVVVCNCKSAIQVPVRCLCDYGFRQGLNEVVNGIDGCIFKISDHEPLSGLFPQAVDHELYGNYFELAMEKHLRRGTNYLCDSQLSFELGGLVGDVDVIGCEVRDDTLYLHIVECKFRELIGNIRNGGISARPINQVVKCLIYAVRDKAWEKIADYKKQSNTQHFNHIVISGAVVSTLDGFSEDEELVMNTVRRECRRLYSEIDEDFPGEFEVRFQHATINTTYALDHQVYISNISDMQNCSKAWRFSISRDEDNRAIWNITKV